MSLAVGVGLVLAVLSAGALNWGFFAQHGAASTLPPLSLRRPFHSLACLFRSPRWLFGFSVGLGGWALYVAALALAPLSLVQATSAGGIGLLALLVSRAGGTELSRREWTGVAVAVGGLLLLGLSLAGGSMHGSAGSAVAVATWLVVSAAVAAVAAGPAAALVASGAGLGVAAGTLYAAGDVATKAALPGGGRLLLIPAVLAAHGLAFVALQLGFQRGGALQTAGLATLCTNALPIAAGMGLFGEGLLAGGLGALRVLAFVAVVVGAAGLARPAAVSARSSSRAGWERASEPARSARAGARSRAGVRVSRLGVRAARPL